jgi:hypothetical protein
LVNGPVLVDLGALGAGVQHVAPHSKLAGNFWQVKIAKLNVDENPVISSHYGTALFQLHLLQDGGW